MNLKKKTYFEIYQVSSIFSTVEYSLLVSKNFSSDSKSTSDTFLALFLETFKSSIHFCRPSKLNVAHKPP